MRFVKTATAEKAHMLAKWNGLVMWTVCGQVVDMGRQSVMVTDKIAPNKDEQAVCGICVQVETRNSHIPGSSR